MVLAKVMVAGVSALVQSSLDFAEALDVEVPFVKVVFRQRSQVRVIRVHDLYVRLHLCHIYLHASKAAAPQILTRNESNLRFLSK